MKVRVTVDFTASQRALLARHWTGGPGLAARADLERFVRSCVDSALVDYRAQEATDDPCGGCGDPQCGDCLQRRLHGGRS